MIKTAPKSCKTPAFDASDALSLSHGSFSVALAFPGDNSSVSTAAIISKWVPIERPEIPLIGRPLAFEIDSADYSVLSSKPSCSKRFFKKTSKATVEARQMLMFVDRFYEGASQIKAMTLNNRSSPIQQKALPNQRTQPVGSVKDDLLDKSWEGPVEFEISDSNVSAEEFCKDAVERARSLSDSWRRKGKKLTAGGMPTDKTGLLAESIRLKNVVPPRLQPLRHKLMKSVRPLKDESSNIVDKPHLRHENYQDDSNYLRDALTSSGLRSGSYDDTGAYSAFETEARFDSQNSPSFSKETITSNSEILQPLGIFNAPARGFTKASTHTLTPRRAKTPELNQTSSFSEPLKAILKGAYDRRAADAMFCQLYLNEHVKNFENLKVAEIAVPESMQHNFTNDDSYSPESCSAHDSSVFAPSNSSKNEATKAEILLTKVATHLNTTTIQSFADKMGRPPAKPNMAREHMKTQKEAMKAIELASIPRHKQLEWSALTPEEVKQKQKAKLEKMALDLDMPKGCWEVASWFR
jgi:hypothetical protein